MLERARELGALGGALAAVGQGDRLLRGDTLGQLAARPARGQCSSASGAGHRPARRTVSIQPTGQTRLGAARD
jgi:hypothetical protein